MSTKSNIETPVATGMYSLAREDQLFLEGLSGLDRPGRAEYVLRAYGEWNRYWSEVVSRDDLAGHLEEVREALAARNEAVARSALAAWRAAINQTGAALAEAAEALEEAERAEARLWHAEALLVHAEMYHHNDWLTPSLLRWKGEWRISWSIIPRHP